MKRLKLNRWLITLVALLMLLLVFLPENDPILTTHQTDIPDSDYFMQKVTVYQFNQDGRIANTLKANRMQHYLDKNVSILIEPRISYNKSKSGVWMLRSPIGELVNDVHLTLQGSVTIEEFAKLNQPESRITTRDLTIDLKRSIASTSEDVLVVSPFFKTESSGFEFDLGNEIIRLTSNVRTEIYQQ
jgi:LPS export ABC transporter protein LptC